MFSEYDTPKQEIYERKEFDFIVTGETSIKQTQALIYGLVIKDREEKGKKAIEQVLDKKKQSICIFNTYPEASKGETKYSIRFSSTEDQKDFLTKRSYTLSTILKIKQRKLEILKSNKLRIIIPIVCGIILPPVAIATYLAIYYSKPLLLKECYKWPIIGTVLAVIIILMSLGIYNIFSAYKVGNIPDDIKSKCLDTPKESRISGIIKEKETIDQLLHNFRSENSNSLPYSTSNNHGLQTGTSALILNLIKQARDPTQKDATVLKIEKSIECYQNMRDMILQNSYHQICDTSDPKAVKNIGIAVKHNLSLRQEYIEVTTCSNKHTVNTTSLPKYNPMLDSSLHVETQNTTKVGSKLDTSTGSIKSMNEIRVVTRAG